MNVECKKCNRSFIPSQANIKIVGPNVEVTCPFCFDFYDGKLLRFAEGQSGRFIPLSPAYAKKMIRIAEYIELNVSDYYDKKGFRHGKKNIRNV
jgi:hypothetical protein